MRGCDGQIRAKDETGGHRTVTRAEEEGKRLQLQCWAAFLVLLASQMSLELA